MSSIRPSVLMFSGEEFSAQTVTAAQAEEYRPDASVIRRTQIRAKQPLMVKGISTDGRLLVRLDSRPLPVLVNPKNIRISGAEAAAAYIRRYALLINQDPERYLASS